MPLGRIEISSPELTPPGIHFATVKSRALRHRADITFYVPPAATDADSKLPLVILLHGIYGSHWAWAFKGATHRVLDRLIAAEEVPPMMLAMPSDGLWGDGSGYVKHEVADYADWIVSEVPHAAALVDPRCLEAPRFITGLSMGGYGALRLGALHADRFHGISAHSSATHLEQLYGAVEEGAGGFVLQDLHPLSAFECLKANAARLPPFRFDCGTEDFLIGPNRQLHEDLLAASIPHVYAEYAGAHDWDYWQEHIADSFRFFAQHLPNEE